MVYVTGTEIRVSFQIPFDFIFFYVQRSFMTLPIKALYNFLFSVALSKKLTFLWSLLNLDLPSIYTSPLRKFFAASIRRSFPQYVL